MDASVARREYVPREERGTLNGPVRSSVRLDSPPPSGILPPGRDPERLPGVPRQCTGGGRSWHRTQTSASEWPARGGRASTFRHSASDRCEAAGLPALRENSTLRTSPHENDAAAREDLAMRGGGVRPEREALFTSEREAREFAAGSGATWVGARLRYFETTDSTNIRARRLADLGWPEGTVVVADRQTAGHGRLGSPWVCPARAGLLVSVVLPLPVDASMTWLTAAGALALADAVEEAGGPGVLRLMIEWPNDMVVPDPRAPGGRRKLGGILVETRSPEARSPGAGPPPAVVLGAGLNVDIREEEFPPELRAEAGSLRSVCGASPDRREILGRFLVALESRVEKLTEELAEGLPGLAVLADELRERSFTLGREVELPAAAPGLEARLGRAVGFDDEMRLVVELPGGATETMAFRASAPQGSEPGGNA